MSLVYIFQNFIRGIVMGLAEGVPGVSGSTLALLMGIYEKFINFLDSVSELIKVVFMMVVGRRKFADVRKIFSQIDFQFFVPLILGMLIALLGFAVFVDFGIEYFPMHVYAAFFGLTLGSLLIPFREVTWSRRTLAITLLTIILTYVALELMLSLTLSGNGFTPLFIFGAGAVAISGMLFPGLSGSFILLILGLYTYLYSGGIRAILNGSASSQLMSDLVIFILGLVFGFMILVKVLKKAMETQRQNLMAIIMGILIVSLKILWPFMDLTSHHPELVHLNPKILPCSLGDPLFSISVFAIIALFTTVAAALAVSRSE